jgi:hypothetical protein
LKIDQLRHVGARFKELPLKDYDVDTIEFLYKYTAIVVGAETERSHDGLQLMWDLAQDDAPVTLNMSIAAKDNFIQLMKLPACANQRYAAVNWWWHADGS